MGPFGGLDRVVDRREASNQYPAADDGQDENGDQAAKQGPTPPTRSSGPAPAIQGSVRSTEAAPSLYPVYDRGASIPQAPDDSTAG
jgi:hypothetical protein